MNARARMKLSRKGQILEALVSVRIVKPRIGNGHRILRPRARLQRNANRLD